MRPCGRLLVVIVVSACACGEGSAGAPGGDSDARTILGRPGYLIITGVRDTTSGRPYRPREGPGPDRHALVWPEGTLSLPDTVILAPFGRDDVGVACGPELSGVGNRGQLVFRDGVYNVSEPLVLSDGVVELQLAGGSLEIRGDQLRYRRPDPDARRDKANLLLMAGLLLLVLVLMRRARQLAKKR